MTLHPDCRTSCRRGEDTVPCRVIGGCGVRWSPVCCLCGVKLDHGHLCGRCSQRILGDLDAIETLIHGAHLHADRHGSRGGGRTVPASRPPLNVDTLDPELAAVRLLPGDESSDTPLLVVLEDWERIIREDRCLAPYGTASEIEGRAHGYRTKATLAGVLGFLRRNHAWAIAEPSFDIAEYARQVRACRRAVGRWETDRDSATRIPCPTIDPYAGECGKPLYVSRGDDEVNCPRCRRTWAVSRLIQVAGRDADIWVDIEAAASLAGVTERTIRNWIRRGHVARRGQLIRVHDIREHAHTLAVAT